jgi:spore coat polysaccharide biosynthesis protein SpsF
MGSTRLPGKVLADLSGRPMLGWIVDRLRTCTTIDDVVIATTTAATDDPLADFASKEDAQVVRGSEKDVLGRLLAAARYSGADLIVRITGDCPLIDPAVTDRVVNELVRNSSTTDYASNVLRRTFPRGLDAEALFLDTLMRLDRIAITEAEREHVTVTVRSSNPALFLTRSVESDNDDSDLRWTVDEERDLEVVRTLYDQLGLNKTFQPYGVVVEHMRRHPELIDINSMVSTWTPETSGAGSEDASG